MEFSARYQHAVGPLLHAHRIPCASALAPQDTCILHLSLTTISMSPFTHNPPPSSIHDSILPRISNWPSTRRRLGATPQMSTGKDRLLANSTALFRNVDPLTPGLALCCCGLQARQHALN
jgi:hypothetical protein